MCRGSLWHLIDETREVENKRERRRRGRVEGGGGREEREGRGRAEGGGGREEREGRGRRRGTVEGR